MVVRPVADSITLPLNELSRPNRAEMVKRCRSSSAAAGAAAPWNDSRVASLHTTSTRSPGRTFDRTLASVESSSRREYSAPFGPRNVTTRVAGSQPVMVTVVMRCGATNPPAGVPGAGVTVAGSARSTAGSPAGLARRVARSVYDIVTTSPTFTWSNAWIAIGMSATTRLPCSARTVSTRWK